MIWNPGGSMRVSKRKHLAYYRTSSYLQNMTNDPSAMYCARHHGPC